MTQRRFSDHDQFVSTDQTAATQLAPRILVLDDTDARDGYGPYLFAITDPKLSSVEARQRLETIVERVQRNVTDYEWADLLAAIAEDGLPVVDVGTDATVLAVRW